MVSIGVTVCWKCLIICTVWVNLAYSLTIGSQTTSRPRLRPSSESVVASEPARTTTLPSGIALYRLINKDSDTTCILLKTDAVVEVNFKLHGFDEKVDSFVPSDAFVTGNCADEKLLLMVITWQWYSLSLGFAKTPGGERWYLSHVELAVSLDVPTLLEIRAWQRDKTLRLYSKEMLIPTPAGMSYVCEEVDIPLATDRTDHMKNVHGSVLLRALQVQAFMYKNENFSEPFECKAQKYFRSETAPVAVGSTLAVAALATVTGYGIYRYFKVKNVQYNPME